MDDKKFIEMVEVIRRLKGFSKEGLCSNAGVNYHRYYRVLKGGEISFSDANKLVEALGLGLYVGEFEVKAVEERRFIDAMEQLII